MTIWLRRLINIRVGEGRRVTLLYTLLLLLILGSVWGRTAADGLFLDKIGTDNYSIRFIAEAVFTVIFTLIYIAFVDRIGNSRLLAAICIITGVLLLVTGLLLSRELTIAYYLFYLIGRTSRVILAVHNWTYIGEFFDTRAARRIFPLIGSAGRVAGVLGGVTLRFVVIPVVHAENVPYLWAVLLVVGAWLTLSIPRWTRAEVTLAEPQGRPEDILASFRGGWRAIRKSRLLQLLAVGTATMTILLTLLNFQTDYVLSQSYQGADELTGLLGLLREGLTNAIALPLQLLLLTRVVNWVGVGWANLFYPIFTVASYGLLGFFPMLPTAVAGLFAMQGFRSAWRNPLDNMLYNGVPRAVKGRARAFVKAILVPVATLIGGVALLLVPRGNALPWYLFALGGAVGLIYLAAAWRTRSAYSHALVDTLTAEDTALYQLAGAGWEAADRAALDHVLARLQEGVDRKHPDNESTTIFLAQLAYEIGGRDALPALSKLIVHHSPPVRVAILEIVGTEGLADPQVRRLCAGGLTDADPAVRRAALSVLERQSWPDDPSLMATTLELMHDPDPGVRVRAISLLLRSGDFYYLTVAASALNELLGSDDHTLRVLSLAALGEMGDPRFVRTLAPHLSDPVESVRRAAAQAIAAVASASAPAWVCDLTLEAAQQALSDPAKAVRLAAIQILAQLDPATTRAPLLEALRDSSARVRDSARQVLENMGSDAVNELETLLDTENSRAREAAIVALLHLSTERYHAQADAEIHDALRQAYRNLALIDALSPLDLPSAALAAHTLNDQNQALLAHIFRVLAALHGEQTVAVIRHNLRATDARARANAIEALETMTSPATARLVAPLSSGADDANAREMIALAQADGKPPAEGRHPPELDQLATDPTAALETLLTGQSAWLKAVALYLVGELAQPGMALLDAPRIISRNRREEVVTSALDSPDPLVAETARHVARRLGLLSEEVSTMNEATLSTIEKIIFLKEVPIFNEMTVTQIRTLAGIAAEVNFADDEVIFHEGDPGDTLYVVVSGRVGIEHEAERGTGSVARLATLESRQYFGEMSIFDRSPRSASAIAIGPTLLLSIGREPLLALVEGDPGLALELIRVLGQRLREANEQLARKTKTAPRKLQKLYDQLM